MDRFGQRNASELAALSQDVPSPAGVRLRMVRDLIKRRGAMAEYYHKYDARMTQLQEETAAGGEPRAEFMLAELPARTDELNRTARQLLDDLESAGRTASRCTGVEASADHGKHSLEAALVAMRVAAKAHLDTASRRNAVLPEAMKRLRRLKRGDKRKDRDWAVDQTKQGDMVLCRIAEQPFWSLGVALPPNGRLDKECNKDLPAVFSTVVEDGSEPEPALTLTWLDAPPSQGNSRRKRGSDGAATAPEGWEKGKLQLFKVHGAPTVVTVSAQAVVYSFRSAGNWRWKIPAGSMLDKVTTLIKILEEEKLDQARDVAGQDGEDVDYGGVSEEEDMDVVDAQAEMEPLLFIDDADEG